MDTVTPTQAATLRRLAAGPGWETPPSGYPTAGSDASRWWRTMGCLARLGYVVREQDPRGRCTVTAYRLTDAGRSALASLPSLV